MRFRFLDVEINPNPRRPVPVVYRKFGSNMRGQSGYLSDLTWLRFGMIYCSAKRLWSRSRVRVAGSRNWSPWLDVSGPWDCCIRTKWIWSISDSQLSVVVAKCCFSSLWRVFSLYRNAGQDDRIFDCLLRSVAVVQAEDVCLFPVCGWFEWPSSGLVGFYEHESWYMALQHYTLPLCLVAISSLSARPMHVVEHMTTRWLMILTWHGLLL